MPLLLHNWKEIVNLWIEATQLADDEGLKALLEYVPPPLSKTFIDRVVFSKNLRQTCVPPSCQSITISSLSC